MRISLVNISHVLICEMNIADPTRHLHPSTMATSPVTMATSPAPVPVNSVDVSRKAGVLSEPSVAGVTAERFQV